MLHVYHIYPKYWYISTPYNISSKIKTQKSILLSAERPKILERVANGVNTQQMPDSAGTDLGLHQLFNT